MLKLAERHKDNNNEISSPLELFFDSSLLNIMVLCNVLLKSSIKPCISGELAVDIVNTGLARRLGMALG